MKRFLTTVYGIVTAIAFSLGLVVAVLFVVALIAGQDLGESLALLAGDIMMWGIALAAVAVLAGLTYIYLDGSHSLVMEKSPKGNDKNPSDSDA
jgi:hypothetical protein